MEVVVVFYSRGNVYTRDLNNVSIAERNATKTRCSAPRTVFACPRRCGRTRTDHQHHVFARNDFGCPRRYRKLRVCEGLLEIVPADVDAQSSRDTGARSRCGLKPIRIKTTVHRKRVWQCQVSDFF